MHSHEEPLVLIRLGMPLQLSSMNCLSVIRVLNIPQLVQHQVAGSVLLFPPASLLARVIPVAVLHELMPAFCAPGFVDVVGF